MALALELTGQGINAKYDPNGNCVRIETPTIQSIIVFDVGRELILKLTQFFCPPDEVYPEKFSLLDVDLAEPDSIDRIVKCLENPTSST